MEKNIYSNPEFFGLEIVAELSKDISYQFDQLVVLRNKKTNKHYIMQDSEEEEIVIGTRGIFEHFKILFNNSKNVLKNET